MSDTHLSDDEMAKLMEEFDGPTDKAEEKALPTGAELDALLAPHLAAVDTSVAPVYTETDIDMLNCLFESYGTAPPTDPSPKTSDVAMSSTEVSPRSDQQLLTPPNKTTSTIGVNVKMADGPSMANVGPQRSSGSSSPIINQVDNEHASQNKSGLVDRVEHHSRRHNIGPYMRPQASSSSANISHSGQHVGAAISPSSAQQQHHPAGTWVVIPFLPPVPLPPTTTPLPMPIPVAMPMPIVPLVPQVQATVGVINAPVAVPRRTYAGARSRCHHGTIPPRVRDANGALVHRDPNLLPQH